MPQISNIEIEIYLDAFETTKINNELTTCLQRATDDDLATRPGHVREKEMVVHQTETTPRDNQRLGLTERTFTDEG